MYEGEERRKGGRSEGEKEGGMEERGAMEGWLLGDTEKMEMAERKGRRDT